MQKFVMCLLFQQKINMKMKDKEYYCSLKTAELSCFYLMEKNT